MADVDVVDPVDVGVDLTTSCCPGSSCTILFHQYIYFYYSILRCFLFDICGESGRSIVGLI